MPTLKVVNEQNAAAGEIALSEGLFSGKVKQSLLHEVTVLWLRNQRAGTVSTKGRSEVNGGGRKPWKQKGTGRARSGSSRSPLWVGGGTIHGPKPRDFSTSVPRAKRRAALVCALSLQFREGNIAVIDGMSLEEPKTSAVAGMLERLGFAGQKVLIVIPGEREIFEKSTRNIPGVMAVTPESLNPYLVLYHQKLLFFKDAVARTEEVFGE